jgi:Flp pilus assembly protein TadG
MPPMTCNWVRIARAGKALCADTRGVILPYVTVMLVVIIGVSLLALDGARFMSLQTQLQNGADALALAGAAELDRLPDAETRAINAINTLVANRTLAGGSSSRTIAVASIQFYNQLPASDSSPLSGGIVAVDAMNAHFVAVTVRPVTLPTLLPAALFGGASVVTTGASAVAGFDQVVCDVTPLFVCNPFETDEMSYEQATRALQVAAADPAIRRRLIRMRQNSGESRRYDPGDYGFLASPTLGSSDEALIDGLARVHRNACFRHRGVNIRQGFVANVGDGFNVRFDLYNGAMVVNRYDSDYRPAENVRKGFVGALGESACAAQAATYWPIGTPPNQATGLPLDEEWPYMDGRMGNGMWDFDTYWQVNHGGSGRERPTIGGQPATNDDPPSRYDVYRYEIDQGFVGDESPGPEIGAPACYRGAVLSAVPDRRVIQAAVINCRSLDLEGGALADVPIAAFGKFFLTLPLMRSQTDIYVEIRGLVTPRDGTADFEMVQLYR